MIAAQRNVPGELCEMHRCSNRLPWVGIDVAANFAPSGNACYMLGS